MTTLTNPFPAPTVATESAVNVYVAPHTIKVGGATYNLAELDLGELDRLLGRFFDNAATYSAKLEQQTATIDQVDSIKAIKKALAEYEAGIAIVDSRMTRLTKRLTRPVAA